MLSLLLSPAENMATAGRLSNALDSERQILERMEGPLIRTKCETFLPSWTMSCRLRGAAPSKVQLELESVQPARGGGARTSRTSDGVSEKRVDIRYPTDLSLSKRFMVTHNFNTLSHADPYPS